MKFYCINLEKRTDRKNSIIEQFAKQNIDLEFFPGLDAKILGVVSLLKTKGMTGCYISHHLLHLKLKSAEDEWSIIIEDDLIICKDLIYHVELWLKTIPKDADIGFFGYYKRKGSSSIHITRDWLFIDKFYGAHFYAVKTSSLPKIIKYTSKIENQIDVQIIDNIQKGNLKGYCSVIPLGKQSGSETNVQKA